jgi:hypothetical protein
LSLRVTVGEQLSVKAALTTIVDLGFEKDAAKQRVGTELWFDRSTLLPVQQVGKIVLFRG